MLIEPEPNLLPSRPTKSRFPGKAKKALFFSLLSGGASFALLVPILVDASIFSVSSLMRLSAPTTEAASIGYNLQTLPLPEPAANTQPSIHTNDNVFAVVDNSALIAQSGPLGTEADIEQRPLSSDISVYTVRAGDTIPDIAKMFNVSANTIIGANNLKGGVVHEGDTLVILPITGMLHTVTKGETLSSLAKTYKSDAHGIAQYNSLADTDALTVGQVVVIPNGELVATVPSAVISHKAKSSSVPVSVKKASGGTTSPLRGAGGPNLGSYFAWPLSGGIITQGLHGSNAVDIGAPRGTDIFASADGTVIVSRSDDGWNGGYGNYVVIEHANGTETLYSHASKVMVSTGDQVTQGELIAKVGTTGEATGPHLHFEVRGAKNPFGSLSVGQGE